MSTKFRWFFIALILLPLVVIGSFYLYWYYRATRSERAVEVSKQENIEVTYTPPSELGDGFDPSINSGMYRVEEVNRESATLKLVYLWPHAIEGEIITPILACPPWDYKIFDIGKKVPRYVSLATMLGIMSETPTTQMMIAGKCSDKSCILMDRGCTLTITPERQDEIR